MAVLVAAACSRGEEVTRQQIPLVDLTTTTTIESLIPVGEVVLDPYPFDRCDALDRSHCLLPFPSDHFSVDATNTVTGQRLNLVTESMPANVLGQPVDPARWNNLDGYSPGTPIITLFESVDLAGSGVANAATIERSLDDDAPIYLYDATLDERIPYWAELDQTNNDLANRLTVIHPARNLTPGSRIVVGIRNLLDDDGDLIAPSADFEAYRSNLFDPDHPEFNERRNAMEEVFADLEMVGMTKEDLQLAWSFTVGSSEGTTNDLRSVTAQSFDLLGDAAPTFSVTSVVSPVDANGEPTAIGRRISGTVQVPLFLTGDGELGNSFGRTAATGLPLLQTSTVPYTVGFECIIPRSIVDAETPTAARALLFGHDHLGSRLNVGSAAPRSLAQRHGYVVCGTDFIGLNNEESQYFGLSVVTDMSNLPGLTDRVKQGLLNSLFVGRLMTHPDGLVSDPAFQSAEGDALISTANLYYFGVGQGAVLGGALAAVSDDITTSVFDAGGANFSTIINRSVDFDDFTTILGSAYPSADDQAVLMGLSQMMWDQTETTGFVPLLGDDDILLQVLYGDHRMPNLASANLARSLDLPVRTPVLGPERQRASQDIFWDLDEIPGFPNRGSAMTVFDGGGAVPPILAIPNRGGTDPHLIGIADDQLIDQAAAFLSPNSRVTNPCGLEACQLQP